MDAAKADAIFKSSMSGIEPIADAVICANSRNALQAVQAAHPYGEQLKVVYP